MKIKIPSWITNMFPDDDPAAPVKIKGKNIEIETLRSITLKNREKLKEDDFSKYIPIIVSLVVAGILIVVISLAISTFNKVNEAVVSNLNSGNTTTIMSTFGGTELIIPIMLSFTMLIICLNFRRIAIPYIILTFAAFIVMGLNIFPLVIVTTLLIMSRRLRL
jgi:hypothetical protein